MLPEDINNKLKRLMKVIEIPSYIDKKGLHLEFTNDRYMESELAGIINDSIFHFALTKKEIESLKSKDAFGQMRRDAWSRFSKAMATKKGDYGELLLFLFLEHFYESQKFVTKVRLRSSAKDQIKGYDCAHFTIEGEDLCLWLGESKLHQSFSGALTDAVSSINDHVKEEYLKDEISILRTNIEIEDGPLKDKMDELLRNPPPIYKLNIRIPIFIGYNWDRLQGLSESDFLKTIESEISDKFALIRKKKGEIKTNFKLVFIVLPFKDLKSFKEDLEKIESANRIGS